MNFSSSLASLRIADLQLFVTASYKKNLTKAAKTHFLSQSAASSAIKRVEKGLQRTLCTHEKRHFTLTPEGEVLLPQIEKWLNSLMEFSEAKNSPSVRIGTTHGISQILLPFLMTDFSITITLMRPDKAYHGLLQKEIDIALVLENAPWKGVSAAEVHSGIFQLYAAEEKSKKEPILLPEDQIEVLSLQQEWLRKYKEPLPVKSRIPSWSLIADICANSEEVGFLPDFLAEKRGLMPVGWQPNPIAYKLLALYRKNHSPAEVTISSLRASLDKSKPVIKPPVQVRRVGFLHPTK